jgi:hypothetical protein
LPETRLSDNRMKINVVGQIKNEMCYENRAFKIFKGNMFPLNVMLHKRVMFFTTILYSRTLWEFVWLGSRFIEHRLTKKKHLKMYGMEYFENISKRFDFV